MGYAILESSVLGMPESPFAAEYEAFRRMLIEARHKSGLTQAELAEAIGRPQSFVSKYETGERRLDVVEFVRITSILRVDPARLIRILRDQFSWRGA